MRYNIHQKQMLADRTTPVGLYLKLREQYAEVLLLESSDYNGKENSRSFICFDSLSTFTVKEGKCSIRNNVDGKTTINEIIDIVKAVDNFSLSFDIIEGDASQSGVFGYTNFDAVQYFEDLTMDKEKERHDTPDIRYDFYRYLVIIDHFRSTLTIIEHVPEGHSPTLDTITRIIQRQDSLAYHFKQVGPLMANMTDQEFKDIVTKCKEHCHRGNIFQIVPSRRFSQAFNGDEFNVYRSLRSINPSPYLFYFDYGSYKIFGSSPEAQIIVKNGVAEIHPIAGTFRRTGNDIEDAKSAEVLAQDPKENAEHTMLVDLARNDLSKNTREVHIEKYKEIQYFSHVIHLVSVVKGTLPKGMSGYQILADTFPAGTLSGAPKYRALELIDEAEPTARGYYGGGLGMISLNGDVNHAIMIRSFFSQNGILHCQAGAGIVIDSQEEKELQEVNNKLAALMQALSAAEQI